MQFQCFTQHKSKSFTTKQIKIISQNTKTLQEAKSQQNTQQALSLIILNLRS